MAINNSQHSPGYSPYLAFVCPGSVPLPNQSGDSFDSKRYSTISLPGHPPLSFASPVVPIGLALMGIVPVDLRSIGNMQLSGAGGTAGTTHP